MRPECPAFLAFPPPPAGDALFSGVRGAPRTPENPTVDSHRPIWNAPNAEITASRFKFRANAPEGRKAIFYHKKHDRRIQSAINIQRRAEFLLT